MGAVPEFHEGPELLRAGQKGNNLALRRQHYKTDTLRFRGALHEQSGGAGSAVDEALREDLGRIPLGAGAKDFATLCNVPSTVRKRRLNRIEALLQGPAVLLTGLRCHGTSRPFRPLTRNASARGLGMPHRSGLRARQIVGAVPRRLPYNDMMPLVVSRQSIA